MYMQILYIYKYNEFMVFGKFFFLVLFFDIGIYFYEFVYKDYLLIFLIIDVGFQFIGFCYIVLNFRYFVVV